MTKKVAIIDYGSGNLHSAFKAVKKAADFSSNKTDVMLTDNPHDLKTATHIILPGVGAFGDCMSGLSNIAGMVDELHEQVISQQRYFLGICVGMQLLAERGLEEGEHKGLGWLQGEVSHLQPSDGSLKIPHMGWNEIIELKPNPLTKGLSGKDFYFVHSYSMKTNEANIAASCDYAENIVAVIHKDNIFGTQFHPEKSQKNGLELLSNFVSM